MATTGNITVEVYSEALGRPVQLSARLPLRSDGKKLRTVYMIPGALESSDALFTDMDVTSTFAYRKHALDDVALIMITPAFSFLTDYHREYRYAHQYYTFVTRELVEITRTLFPLSDRVEDTAIYGFSMGGYGAYYCGLNTPGVYGHVGAQSGMLDIQWALENRPFMTIKHERIFGTAGDIRNTPNDLFAVTAALDAKKARGEGPVPRLYQSWGSEDYLKIPNEHMHQHLLGLKNLDYTYYPIEGVHSWGPHNQGVDLFLEWFLAGQGGDAECPT